MKKVMMICAFFIALTGYVKAQQGGGGSPEERTKKTIEALTEKLKLTADQKTKITTIFEDQTKATLKARDEAGSDRDAMREKFLAIRKATDEKVNAVLTDEQKVAYKTWQEENQRQGRGGGGPGRN